MPPLVDVELLHLDRYVGTGKIVRHHFSVVDHQNSEKYGLHYMAGSYLECLSALSEFGKNIDGSV